MTNIKKNDALSTPYEDTPSNVCAINKALPISQLVVRHIKIKTIARILCPRNNVLKKEMTTVKHGRLEPFRPASVGDNQFSFKSFHREPMLGWSEQNFR